MEGVEAVENPIRAATGFLAMAAVAAIPTLSQAQDAHVSEAALTMLRADAATSTAATPHAEKKQKTTHKAAKTTRRKTDAAAVPRSTFEDRTAHTFDPLSLTLAPDSRLDPTDDQYNQVTGKFETSDSQLVARTPDDSVNAGASSASIENLGLGRNMTVVVPLFQILNSLSPGPAPQ
jgi:predicted lysophospholipase L1 biosynthesis ABC-type transport system permease subunit